MVNPYIRDKEWIRLGKVLGKVLGAICGNVLGAGLFAILVYLLNMNRWMVLVSFAVPILWDDVVKAIKE